MFTYCIAGVPKSSDFGHAKLVADKLKHSLPNFSYEVIVKDENEYQSWLQTFCDKQKWKINENPLIWKRVNNICGPYHLIGGINEFFEHLVEYYNIDTRLDKQIKKQISLDNQERMSFMLSEQIPVCRETPRKICITGATYPSTGYLVSELLQLKQLYTKEGVTICLHHTDVNKYVDLIKIKNEMCNLEGNLRGFGAVCVVNNIEVGLLNCDLLIVIGSIKREENEDKHLWTKRNYLAMKSLSAILNHHCPESCKVLLMGMELLCFNLSVLAEKTDKVYLYNFVGVTGHHGMDTLPKVSRVTGIPLSSLHCPPVWGFVGVAKYIDLNHMVYHGESAVGDGISSNGCANQKNHKYLQNMSLTTNLDVNTDGDVDYACPVKSTNYPTSCLPEVRAAVTLITEWFENTGSKTISVAVFSDGTFDFPFGMFISQPVRMENGEWKPNYDFPSPDKKFKIDLIAKATEILIEYDLGRRFNIKWRESASRISAE